MNSKSYIAALHPVYFGLRVVWLSATLNSGVVASIVSKLFFLVLRSMLGEWVILHLFACIMLLSRLTEIKEFLPSLKCNILPCTDVFRFFVREIFYFPGILTKPSVRQVQFSPIQEKGTTSNNFRNILDCLLRLFSPRFESGMTRD